MAQHQKFGKSDSLALWTMQNSAEIEYLSASFKPIQQYRAVEFDRDWNTRDKGYEGYQLIGTWEANFRIKSSVQWL